MIRFFARPRVIAITVLITGVLAAVGILLGSVALLRLGGQANMIERAVTTIQNERVRNIRAGCQRTNAQNRSIVEFITREASSPHVVLAARDAFPRLDCAEYTRQQTMQSSAAAP